MDLPMERSREVGIESTIPDNKICACSCHAQVKNVMTAGVETVQRTATLMEAAQKMRTRDVGVLPVMDGHRAISGILTDRDITINATAEGKGPSTTVVDILPCDDVISCFDDQEIWEAAKLMEEHEVRRLPVLNRNQELVGIISLGDVAFKTRDEHLCCEILSHVSEPFTAAID
jgi:predicted transcriptional regulator